MGDAHCRIGDVYVLSSGPRSAKSIYFEILRFYFNLDILSYLRKNVYGSKRGVAALIGIKGRNPHQAVDPYL
jgi:hypothetical protein